MLKQTDNFGYLNYQSNEQQPLISQALVQELGSGNVRVAFSGILYLLGQDYIEREIGKCIFTIKKVNTQNDNFSISVLRYDGEEVVSKQVNVFATYQINEIVGQIKWTDSLILSNVYRFSFDRQEAVILISIALEESINRMKLLQNMSQTKSIQNKITKLEKQLNITQLQKKRLQKLHTNERFQRLERLWKLEKMQVMSRNKKKIVDIPSRHKKIKKSTPIQSSENKSSIKKSCLKKHSTIEIKQQKQIQKINKERSTPYQILKKSTPHPHSQVQIIQSPIQSSKQILQSSKKNRKSTGESKALCQQVGQYYHQQHQFQQQMVIATVSPVHSSQQIQQLQVLMQCANSRMRQQYKSYQKYKNFRIFYQGRHNSNKLFTFMQNVMIVKNIGRKNTFVKSILSNLIDEKSNPIKPIKVTAFSFDTKIMILADTGRLYVADSQKLKVLFQVNLQDQVVFDFCLNKILQQKQGYDTFLAVTHSNVYFIDTWIKQKKLLLTNKNRKQKSFFKCITCLPNGDYAVGFDNGVVQIISCKNNSQLLVFNERKIPVLFLQCSNDGMFLLITDYQSITLFPIDKKRFQHTYQKKFSIKSLHLKNNFLELLKKQKDGYQTIPAKFNEVSIGKQEYIIWSFANLVLVWSLHGILNDVLQHKIFKASHIVTHTQFKYNDPSHIVVGTMKDIVMHELPK